MRSDELITAARFSAFIGDEASFTDFTDARMLLELTDKQQSVFEDVVVKARAGYWAHEFFYTTTANDSRYRIPPRSVVGGLEKVEIATTAAGPYTKLAEIPIALAQDYRSASGAVGTPNVFVCSGDLVDLIPTPTAGMRLKLTYYIRPSRLTTSQSSTQGGAAVDRGRITVIDTVARVLTVNALPFDYPTNLTGAAQIVSGVQKIDVVHPDGWHELSYVNGTQTISGVDITLTDTQDMTDIQVGDYVRVADQTDWPCLPDDFHRSLADSVAVKVLLMQGLDDKAQVIGENSGNDILRFRSLLLPRVKAEPKEIGMMRRTRGPSYPGWRFS